MKNGDRHVQIYINFLQDQSVFSLAHNMTVDFRIVSFHTVPSLSSLCEHAPYDDILYDMNEMVE